VQNVYDILKISVIYGIVVIFVGLLINWVNLVRQKKFITMIFDRQGLCGGAMYATGIYMGFQYTATGFKSLPSDPWITPVLLLGALGLLLKEPLLYIQDKRNGREVPKLGNFIGSVIMDWVLELLETFTGYLSNTLSFFRVAGYGIAHVSLMAAFEVLAEMPGEHTVWGILILVFGNVLVIALEGLSSGIQALRLNYYEFFTKFFNGTGIAYSPVSLHSKDQ
jgi:V/A-type H+-transporting ATPase subunit I